MCAVMTEWIKGGRTHGASPPSACWTALCSLHGYGGFLGNPLSCFRGIVLHLHKLLFCLLVLGGENGAYYFGLGLAIPLKMVKAEWTKQHYYCNYLGKMKPTASDYMNIMKGYSITVLLNAALFFRCKRAIIWAGTPTDVSCLSSPTCRPVHVSFLVQCSSTRKQHSNQSNNSLQSCIFSNNTWLLPS